MSNFFNFNGFLLSNVLLKNLNCKSLKGVLSRIYKEYSDPSMVKQMIRLAKDMRKYVNKEDIQISL